MLRKERKIIIITGKSGTGKTKLSREILKLFPKKIILDILEEYEAEKIYQGLGEFLQNESVLNTSLNVCIRNFSDSDVDYICKWCLIAGDVCLAFEEFENYVSRYDSFKYLDEIIRRGRHNDVTLLAVSQRVPDFPPLFRSQITSFFTFYQDEPIDIKHLIDRGLEEETIKELQRCEGLALPMKDIHYLCQGDTLEQIKDWNNGRNKEDTLQSKTQGFCI